jgi:hypothetical protein
MAESVGPAGRVFALLSGGDVDGAAQEASRFRPQLVLEAIDYQDVAEHAERYRDLVIAWLPLVDPLHRPEIAAWFVDNSVADMAYLDDQGMAAQLLASSAQEAALRLADILGTAPVLCVGPDAGLTKREVARLVTVAEQMRVVAETL